MAFRALEGAAAAARASLESGFTTLRDLDSEGADFADVAVRDAIAQGLIPGPRAVLEKVRELDQLPGRCLKTCLIELAGAMKLHEAAHVLVECLGDPDDDELAEAAAKSLSRLGAPSVVRQIRTQYPDKPWDFRLFAIGALQPIKTGGAETTLQALLEIEDDPALRGRIFDALRFHFTRGAAACMRAEIQEPAHGCSPMSSKKHST